MKTITLYGTEICPNCNVAKKFLTDKGIEFEYIVLNTDRLIDNFIRETSQTSVPVLKVNNKYSFGFNKDDYNRLLQED